MKEIFYPKIIQLNYCVHKYTHNYTHKIKQKYTEAGTFVTREQTISTQTINTTSSKYKIYSPHETPAP